MLKVKIADLDATIETIMKWMDKECRWNEYPETFNGSLVAKNWESRRVWTNQNDNTFSITGKLAYFLRGQSAHVSLTISFRDCLFAFTSFEVNLKAKEWEKWAAALFKDIEYLGNQQLAVLQGRADKLAIEQAKAKAKAQPSLNEFESEDSGLPTWEEFTAK